RPVSLEKEVLRTGTESSFGTIPPVSTLRPQRFPSSLGGVAMKKGPLHLGILAALVGLLFIGAGPANATHAWNGYHWSRPSNPFTVTFGSNVSSTWSSHLATAAADWSRTSGACNNPSNPVRCVVVAGGSKSRNCRPADGRDEDFNNADLLDVCNRGSCMDYSSDPTNNTTPNQHDYDELVIIYGSHLDGAALIARSNPADEGVDLEDPSAWGQAKRVDSKGRGIEFERQLAGGGKLVTFVLWAE